MSSHSPRPAGRATTTLPLGAAPFALAASGATGELPTFTRPVSAGRRSLAVAALAAALTLAAATWSWRREAAPVAAATPDATALVASIGRRPSHGGRYHAEVVATTAIATGVRQSWAVRLTHLGDRPVADARLTARVWAPETGETSPVRPSVRYAGAGRYRLDGVYLPRPGWWNVALVIDAASGTDSVAFNVVTPPATR